MLNLEEAMLNLEGAGARGGFSILGGFLFKHTYEGAILNLIRCWRLKLRKMVISWVQKTRQKCLDTFLCRKCHALSFAPIEKV